MIGIIEWLRAVKWRDTMTDIALSMAQEQIKELRAEHQRIVDHHDMRSELHTNDADLAATLVSISRRALEPKP